jgi:hypothetical protein
MRSTMHVTRASAVCAGAFAVLASAGARPARADVSSWMAFGGGYAGQVNRDTAALGSAGAFTYSMGVGTTPLRPLVVGGLLRGTTMFGLGTDLGLAIRGATGGFARGDWGLALDAGAAWRSWGGNAYGAWPLQGVVTLGAPFGFQLALGGELASVSGGRQAEGFFAALELDLLRLTVTRQGATERWWPNPAPAGGHQEAAAAAGVTPE